MGRTPHGIRRLGGFEAIEHHPFAAAQRLRDDSDDYGVANKNVTVLTVSPW